LLSSTSHLPLFEMLSTCSYVGFAIQVPSHNQTNRLPLITNYSTIDWESLKSMNNLIPQQMQIRISDT
jgi:hypothetical protein